jgi:hypothetical protein
MKTSLCLCVLMSISFLTFIACDDKTLVKTDVCEHKPVLTLLEDSLLVELSYQKNTPIKGANFSLRLEKIQGDMSEDICKNYTSPEVLVFVKLIQGECEYLLNPFQFGRCPQHNLSTYHSSIATIYQGCKITDDINGYTWVMAYDNFIFSRHSLMPYAKTLEDLRKLEANPSGYTYKLWIKKRC